MSRKGVIVAIGLLLIIALAVWIALTLEARESTAGLTAYCRETVGNPIDRCIALILER